MEPLRPDGKDLLKARVSQKCTNCQQVGLRDINTETSPPTIDDDGSKFAFTLVMATSSSGQLVRPKTKSKQARKNSTNKSTKEK